LHPPLFEFPFFALARGRGMGPLFCHRDRSAQAPGRFGHQGAGFDFVLVRTVGKGRTCRISFSQVSGDM